MKCTTKPTYKTTGAVALLAARRGPVRTGGWALVELEQKPGAAGCVSETATGGSCQDSTALDER